MTPEEIGFLSDIDKGLSDLRAMILDRLLTDIDTDARNRPLQDYVHEVMKKINHLQRLGLETVIEGATDCKPDDESFEWDVQKECTITKVDSANVVIEFAPGGECQRYDPRTLRVEPRYGSIRRPDGSTFKGWSFSSVVGETEDGHDIHQFCGAGTKGWICINTTTGVCQFVPRPVEQQDYS